MRICIKSLTGKSHYFKVNALWSIGYVKFLYQERFGTAVAGQRLIFAGKQMKDQPTLADYNIQNGMSIHMVFRLTGGKPVIYLLPPVEMDVSVSLCLTPQWSFSAIYPVAAKEPINFVDGDVGQGTKWNVRAHPGGLLTDKATGIEVTYLFWEAECVCICGADASAESFPEQTLSYRFPLQFLQTREIRQRYSTLPMHTFTPGKVSFYLWHKHLHISTQPS